MDTAGSGRERRLPRRARTPSPFHSPFAPSHRSHPLAHPLASSAMRAPRPKMSISSLAAPAMRPPFAPPPPRTGTPHYTCSPCAALLSSCLPSHSISLFLSLSRPLSSLPPTFLIASPSLCASPLFPFHYPLTTPLAVSLSFFVLSFLIFSLAAFRPSPADPGMRLQTPVPRQTIQGGNMRFAVISNIKREFVILRKYKRKYSQGNVSTKRSSSSFLISLWHIVRRLKT